MLKRDIPERVWVFDMEWVPDAEAAKRLFGLSADTPEETAIRRLWAEYGASDAKPRPFLKYLLSRVVSIAFVSRYTTYDGSDKSIAFSIHSYPKLPIDESDLSETRIIEQFLTLIGDRNPQLVGYNSFESDVQVLIQRGLVNEVSAPIFCRRPANRWDAGDFFARWENETHLDLIKLFSSGAMKPTLNEFAKLCGLPGKIDVDGEQVVDLWLKRDLKSIVEYNRIDALNTYLLWLRIVHFCGKLSSDDYMSEQMHFRDFLESEAKKPDAAYITSFLDHWEY